MMIIYLAMIFSVVEVLSAIFNQYFYSVFLWGIRFPVNISVVFFCLAFFILDIVTELYGKKIADKLIYGKLICQIMFVLLGRLGIAGAGLAGSQIDKIVSAALMMVLNGIIASLIGYKLTAHIMYKLKIKYDGRFLIFRYIASTIPGELIFSLVFTLLSFSKGRPFEEIVMIFFTLSLIKILLSLVFSLIVTPLTKILSPSERGGLSFREFFPFA